MEDVSNTDARCQGILHCRKKVSTLIYWSQRPRRTSVEDVTASAAWTADQFALGAHMQEDLSSYEFLPDVVIARQPERMVQEARGHGGSSSWFSLA